MLSEFASLCPKKEKFKCVSSDPDRRPNSRKKRMRLRGQGHRPINHLSKTAYIRHGQTFDVDSNLHSK